MHAYFIDDFYIVYVVDAFTTLNWKAKYKHMSPFSSPYTFVFV